MTEKRFPVSMDVEGRKAVLRVKEAHLETRDAEEFEAACRRLLEVGQPLLVVDLAAVETIQSVLIGEVAKTKVIASEDGRRFLLVASEKMAGLFRMILGELVDIEVR